MSDSATDPGQVPGPPSEDEPAELGPSASYGTVAGTPTPGETVDEAITELEGKVAEAREKKEAADRTLADADGRLTALRTLKPDSEKAAAAYEKVHDQLTIDQQSFRDYYESELDSLEKLLGPEAVAEVKKRADARKSDYDAAVAAVEAAKAALAAAEGQRAASDAARRAKADRVGRYKQLATTIGARQATLKSMQSEVAKARQAGQYALAFWLLECRDFKAVLDEGSAQLVEPDELPGRLLAAVNESADAERDHAANESAVTKRRSELAEAEKRLADQKSQGEARLREQLKQLSPAGS